MLGKVLFKNTQISYSVTGKGPVVVWLHGFMEDKSIWKGQLEVFDTLTTNICVDLLGHGQTGNVSQKNTMELQAQALEVVLNHLNIDTYTIIGHSMGGYVGLALLEKQIHSITHFVLLNSTSLPDTKEKKENRKRALKIVEQQKETYARMGVMNLFTEDTRKLYKQEVQQLISVAQNTSAQGISAALLGMMERTSKQEVLKKHNGYKLIVSGEMDPVLSLETSFEEAKYVNAVFKKLEGGHMSYVESKNQLNTILKSFLSFY